MRVSFEMSSFPICYHSYYLHYFIALRSWFLTYIYSDFENILWIKKSCALLLNPCVP